MRGVLIATCVLLACACHRPANDGPPCSTVAASFMKLARGELDTATLDDATRRAVADQLPALRDSLAQLCTEGRWSPQVRDCLVRAADHAAFEACERQLTDAQRAALDRATRPDAAK